MNENHYKSAVFSKAISVDEDNSIINGVVIVQKGIDKDAGFFTDAFLSDLIQQGNAQKQGVKSRFGHPNMCKTTLGTFIGRYKNFRLSEGNDSVIADLHLAEITKKTSVEGQSISMYDYITTMAKENPDMFGNSIHFSGTDEIETKTINGKEQQVEVYTLQSFIASDLVDSPCAADNLFKSTDDLGIITTQFLDENPQVFELIQKDSSVIMGFFKRYANYLTKNQKQVDMGFLDKIKGVLKQTKDIDLTLASGELATVVTDAEIAQVGDLVNDENGTALTDGEHILNDGRTFVIESGAITEIKEKEAESEEESEVTESIQAIEKGIEGINTVIKEHGDVLELLAKNLSELTSRQTQLAKSVKSIPFDTPPAEPKRKKKETRSIAEQWLEKRNNKN